MACPPLQSYSMSTLPLQPEPIINPPCGVPAAGTAQEYRAPINSLPFQFDKIMHEKVLCWLSMILCNTFHSLWIAVWGPPCLNLQQRHANPTQSVQACNGTAPLRTTLALRQSATPKDGTDSIREKQNTHKQIQI